MLWSPADGGGGVGLCVCYSQCSKNNTCKFSALFWGVTSFQQEKYLSHEQKNKKISKVVIQEGFYYQKMTHHFEH